VGLDTHLPNPNRSSKVFKVGLLTFRIGSISVHAGAYKRRKEN
jgi:hypothetical protein